MKGSFSASVLQTVSPQMQSARNTSYSEVDCTHRTTKSLLLVSIQSQVLTFTRVVAAAVTRRLQQRWRRVGVGGGLLLVLISHHETCKMPAWETLLDLSC